MYEFLIEGVEIAFGPSMPAPPPQGLCYSQPYFPKQVVLQTCFIAVGILSDKIYGFLVLISLCTRHKTTIHIWEGRLVCERLISYNFTVGCMSLWQPPLLAIADFLQTRPILTP
jgi:hypothetical protein